MMNAAQRKRAVAVHDRWEAWAKEFEQTVCRDPKLSQSQLGTDLRLYLADMKRHRDDLLVNAVTVVAAAKAAYQLYRDARTLREFASWCMTH